MTEPQPSRRQGGRLGCVILVVILAAGCVLAWRGWSLAAMIAPVRTHQQAERTWSEQRPATYEIAVWVVRPLRENEVIEMSVTDNAITRAASINPGLYRFQQDPPRYDLPPQLASAYTVDGLFGQAERIAQGLGPLHIHTPDMTHILYDPAYGYPQRIVQNSCIPLLNDLPACITRYEVVSFTPGP